MKKSIFIASFILLLVVGWIGSGQFTNVNAQDDTNSSTESNSKTVEKITIEDNGNKVEIKEFNFSQIDQSIELQGQTTHNKKIDVKSETTGNITNIAFKRGDKVSKGDELIKISIEIKTKFKSLLTLSPLEKLSLLIFPEVSDLTSIFLLCMV